MVLKKESGAENGGREVWAYVPSGASEISQLFATDVSPVCIADNIAGTMLGQTMTFGSCDVDFFMWGKRPSIMSNAASFTLGSQQ